MPADEWDPAEEGTDKADVEKPVAPTMSDVDQQTLAALKATGLSVAELAARARRDVEREQAQVPAAVGPEPTGAAGTGDDDLITVRQSRQEAAANAEKVAGLIQQEMARGRISDVISAAAEQAFGMEPPAEEMEIIKGKVAVKFRENISLAGKERPEFEREITRLTTEAVKERQAWYEKARKSPGDTKVEMDKRMEAQRSAPVSGRSAGSGKPSAPAIKVGTTPGAALAGTTEFHPEHPSYGIGVRQQSDAELEATFQADMKRHNEEVAAGR